MEVKFRLPLITRLLVPVGAMIPPFTVTPPLVAFTVPLPPRVEFVFTTMLLAVTDPPFASDRVPLPPYPMFTVPPLESEPPLIESKLPVELVPKPM